jgi:hypothetical protein
MWIGVGSMGERLFTDKLVFGWLEGVGAWSLDSATPVILAYPAHASGSSTGNPLGRKPSETEESDLPISFPKRPTKIGGGGVKKAS